jgi:signal peptidase I
MMPTLLDGDFILVNKYTFGIRLPVLNKKIIDINSPKRGDVMVFRYPVDPSVDYIKRVIGVPGDTVSYANKRLTINGIAQPRTRLDDYLQKGLYYTPRYEEKLGNVQHQILIEPDQPPFVDVDRVFPFPYRDNCHYNSEGFVCIVPPGHYFMMGDNRDKSSDGRYWGFVPDGNIVGKAFGIWFHADSLIPPSGIDLKRIGSFN